MTLCKFLNLTGLQFPHLSNGDKKVTCFCRVYCEDEIIYLKYLTQCLANSNTQISFRHWINIWQSVFAFFSHSDHHSCLFLLKNLDLNVHFIWLEHCVNMIKGIFLSPEYSLAFSSIACISNLIITKEIWVKRESDEVNGNLLLLLGEQLKLYVWQTALYKLKEGDPDF